ncbi:MAG: hypothetical protein H6591_07045 [Flavobacteriales bacterium]|nr:hypothetical protein [Flavobacteriales bacterium]
MTWPDTIQMVSFPLEVVGLTLTLIEIYMSKIANRIEKEMDRVGDPMFRRYAKGGLVMMIGRWRIGIGAQIAGIAIGGAIDFLLLRWGHRVGIPYATTTLLLFFLIIPFWKYHTWLSKHKWLFSLPLFAITIPLTVSLIGIRLLWIIASNIFSFFNRFGKGKATGGVGLALGGLGLICELVQVVLIEIHADRWAILTYWSIIAVIVLLLVGLVRLMKRVNRQWEEGYSSSSENVRPALDLRRVPPPQ